MTSYNIHLSVGRPEMTDNRLVITNEANKVLKVYRGGKTQLAKDFSEFLSEVLLDKTALKTYQTHTLPHYVHQYFGGDLTIQDSGMPNTYIVEGSKRHRYVKAYTASAARRAVRELVVAETGLKDKRIPKKE